MRKIIFYFTGTGNSCFIAKRLSEKLNAELIPIASVIRNRNDYFETELAGIVYPVYYANTPNIVREFCRKTAFHPDTRLFAVCNYGGGRGEAIKTVETILKGKGRNLSSSFGVQMPQNAFLKKYERKEKVLSKGEAMIDRVITCVHQNKNGHHAQNISLDVFAQSFLFILKPVFRKYLIQKAGLHKGASLEAAIYRLDSSFVANEKCTGCGICASVCPVDNITMNNGKPEWQHRCENCLACVNFCPVNAIDNEITDKGYRYKHPAYSLKAAMMQRKFNDSV